MRIRLPKGSAYVLPIYINGSEVSLYIAVDSEVTIGQMPVTRKIAVKAGSIDVTGEKHNSPYRRRFRLIKNDVKKYS